MPSPDMLKRLLDEFNDQEAHTRAEITVITQQIEELEKRVHASQQRLELVEQDKNKVMMMAAHYSGGEWRVPNGNNENRTALPPAEPIAEGSSFAQKLSIPTPQPASTATPSRPATSRLRQMSEAPPPPEPLPLGQFSSSLDVAPSAASPATPPPLPSVPSSLPPPSEPASTTGGGDFLFGSSYQFGMQSDSEPATTTPPPPSPSSVLSSSFFSSESSEQPEQPAGNPFLKAVISQKRDNIAPNQSASGTTTTSTSATGEMQLPPEPDPFEADLQAMAQQQQPAQQAGGPQISDLESDEEADDTVKSINDALRGLFR